MPYAAARAAPGRNVKLGAAKDGVRLRARASSCAPRTVRQLIGRTAGRGCGRGFVAAAGPNGALCASATSKRTPRRSSLKSLAARRRPCRPRVQGRGGRHVLRGRSAREWACTRRLSLGAGSVLVQALVARAVPGWWLYPSPSRGNDAAVLASVKGLSIPRACGPSGLRLLGTRMRAPLTLAPRGDTDALATAKGWSRRTTASIPVE